MILNKNTRYYLEQQAQKYIIKFNSCKEIFIFGAGELGKVLATTLQKYSFDVAFIENDDKKIGSIIDEKKVFSLAKCSFVSEKNFIVIACSIKNRKSIEKQLIDAGYKEEKDFVYIDQFLDVIFPIWAFYAKNNIFVRTAQISLTERCTLKCKHCAHACYNVDINGKDMDFEFAIKSLDVFFEKIDYINEFVLIGGEPFLYSKIAEVIDYLCQQYSDKISNLSITTNGTIIPKDGVLEAISKNKVFIHISNYSNTIPRLKQNYDGLKDKLEFFNINFKFDIVDEVWTDYGLGKINRNISKAELVDVFDNCKTPCREIRGDNLYYCVMARSVADNLNLEIGKNDYFELSTMQDTDRWKLLAYQLGYSDKGYLDMCNHCYGADRFEHPVLAAEQL